MQQTILTTLLLGAGASFVAALPAAEHKSHHHHHHSSSSTTSATYNPTSINFFTSPIGTAPPSTVSVAAISAAPTAYSNQSCSVVWVTANSSSLVGPTAFSSLTLSTYAAPSANSTFSAIGPASTSSISSSSLSTYIPSAASSSVSAVATPDVTDKASSSCTFTSASEAIESKKSCSSIVLNDIAVPAGTTLDMTDLADGTTVTFEGTTTFGYEEWDGPLISFSGTSITVTGASGHEINMDGQNWWDGEGSNGGKTKPKGFYAHDLTDSVIKNLNIKNTPIQCFSVNGASNLQINDVTIDDSAGDADDLGHNTDAFDIGSSTGVYITGAVVKNQDDCMAINSGTDISFTGGSCSGGHGLSIGSVGGRSDNTVENVYIADSTISDSANGVRIKTVSGATGSVKNITYSEITLSGITDYGIVIEQDYENGDPTGTPTSGVPVTDLTLNHITGSVSSGAAPYYILCASCSDWTVTGVDVTGGTASKKCEGEPSGVKLC